MMKAAVFVEPGRIVLDDKRIPGVGPLDALIKVSTTTICGTDIHILKGESPVARGAERAGIRIGDTVAVFAQGPIGRCATAGAKLSGATTVIGVDRLANRLEIARRMGADHAIDSSRTDPVEEIMRLTDGRGVDVAIEALGTQATFEACLRVLRPGGTLSSLGVYSTDLVILLSAFAAGLGDHQIVTTLCPGGKERSAG